MNLNNKAITHSNTTIKSYIKINHSAFKRIDIFGRNLMFEERNTQTFQTAIGATLSFILFISVMIIGLLFGKEIYERKTPYILKSEEIGTKEETHVDLKSFPLIFSIFDHDGNKITENINSLFNIKVTYFTISSKMELVEYPYYGFSQCNAEEFTSYQIEVGNIISNQRKNAGWQNFCLNYNKSSYNSNNNNDDTEKNGNLKDTEDFLLYNPYSYPDSASIKITIDECNEGLRFDENYINYIDYENAPKCNSQIYDTSDLKSSTTSTGSSTTTSILDSFIFRIDAINSFLDYKNYSSPKISYIYSNQINLGKGLVRNVFLNLGKEILISDNAWLLENLNQESIIFIKDLREQPLLPTYKNEILLMQISVSNQLKKTSRIYLKIQELFAKIGGLFNGLYIIFQVLIYDYVRFKFKTNYSKYCIEYNNNYENVDLKSFESIKRRKSSGISNYNHINNNFNIKEGNNKSNSNGNSDGSLKKVAKDSNDSKDNKYGQDSKKDINSEDCKKESEMNSNRNSYSSDSDSEDSNDSKESDSVGNSKEINRQFSFKQSGDNSNQNKDNKEINNEQNSNINEKEKERMISNESVINNIDAINHTRKRNLFFSDKSFISTNSLNHNISNVNTHQNNSNGNMFVNNKYIVRNENNKRKSLFSCNMDKYNINNINENADHYENNSNSNNNSHINIISDKSIADSKLAFVIHNSRSEIESHLNNNSNSNNNNNNNISNNISNISIANDDLNDIKRINNINCCLENVSPEFRKKQSKKLNEDSNNFIFNVNNIKEYLSSASNSKITNSISNSNFKNESKNNKSNSNSSNDIISNNKFTINANNLNNTNNVDLIYNSPTQKSINQISTANKLEIISIDNNHTNDKVAINNYLSNDSKINNYTINSNISNSKPKPLDSVKLSQLNIMSITDFKFKEEKNIRLEKQKLLNSIKKLNYLSYLKDKMFLFICHCSKTVNKATFVLENNRTQEMFSFNYYLKRLLRFKNFEKNIVNLQKSNK